MVALKCARAKKVVMVRIDNHHHSFLELGSPELRDFENQHQKIAAPIAINACLMRLWKINWIYALNVPGIIDSWLCCCQRHESRKQN
jgi:hypothetical protein